MSLTKEKAYRVLEYVLPALLTTLIFLFALCVKRVFPFGKGQFAVMDFNEQLVPFLTNYWDVLHGKANPLVNWNVAAGGSIITSFFSDAFVSYFSPTCLIVAILPRKTLLYSVVFLMIIKLALMATTSYICFKKYFGKLNSKILLLFSLTYTFSGWALFHLSYICWYDILILLPLLLLAAKRLVEKGKIGWFVACFAYMLVINYYMTYMVAVGTIITATLYIIFVAKQKKQLACKFFAAMSFGVLIAFFALVPSALTTLKSNRFATSYVFEKSDLYKPIFSKLMVVMMSALPFVFSFKLFLKFKKDNFSKFFLLSFCIMSVGIFIEPINRMWHTGSYFGFPLRYGYLIVLLLEFASLYYINKYLCSTNQPNLLVKLLKTKNPSFEQDKETGSAKLKQNLNVIYISLFFAAFLIIMLIFVSIGNMVNPCYPVGVKYFIIVLAAFVFAFCIILFALKMKNKKLKLGNVCGGVIIFVFCLVQIVCNTVAFVGNSFGETTSYRITNVYNLDLSSLNPSYKLKDREALYDLDMGQLVNYPSMSSFIAISSEREHKGYVKLGYNTQTHILYSSGSTMLTDVLLGNKYVLSAYALDERYYNKIDEFDYLYEKYEQEEENAKHYELKTVNLKVYLYELNLKMQPVYTTNVNLAEILKEDYVENQNILFKALYNSSQDVMTPLDYELQENDTSYTITVTAPENKMVYMASSAEFDAKINSLNRSIFQGLNDLGSENLVIKINKENITKADLKTIKFATFDAELFCKLHNAQPQNETGLTLDGSKIKVELDNALNHKYAFVPFTNLYDMVAVNNGESCAVSSALEGFMMVNLKDGKNSITLSYKPKYIKACLIISAVAVVGFIIFVFLNKKFDLLNKKPIVWFGFVGACIVLLVVGFIVYLKPFAQFFVELLQ